MSTLYNLYDEYVVQLDPLMWGMGRVRGVDIDNKARLVVEAELAEKIEGFVEEAQDHVPESIWPLKHVKTKPETDRPVREIEVESEKVKTCTKCGADHVIQATHTARKGGRNNIPSNPCYKASIELRSGIDVEYDIVLPFNPGSDDQLRAYVEMFRHPMGRNWKTGEKTLDKKQLQKLIDKYPKHTLYKLAQQIRQLRKAKGYASAWIPDELGRCYGQFKNVPETLRFSQADHNWMNVSHRADAAYSEELRKCIVAPPGYVIMEADSASIEAVFTGMEMGSMEYVELAKKGIHAWWALKTLGMEATPANIKWVKNAKEHSILYATKKRTVHGVSYGMGAKLLHESYPDSFSTKAAAQKEIDEFYALVPDLQRWQKATMDWAHKHAYLQSPWGFRNYYYRVYSYDWRTQKWRMGDDAKEAIAFKPQHANAMFQRENLKMLGKTWLRPYMGAIGHCHDSNGAIIPEDRIDEAAQIFGEIMSRPVKQYSNIQIGVEIKIGTNWAEMKSHLVV